MLYWVLRNSGRAQGKREHISRFPILETIQSLLKDPNVLKLVCAIGSCVWITC